ncbi:MAG: 30S ribosomal protein S27ae [Candidatus Undinarchaeales archaeon]|jgi:small subunit ribosomal protein S27Ae|nr:30S ribosomal protein S27ae [Candidatus Undinarchaeales archaeon]MDP7491586.1 30S ribosomal protein S27ae [Candidatus Undinarchaeales archaeon]
MVSSDGTPNAAYSLDGEKLKRNNKPCPRCGDGVFLAKHADRFHCGRCGYTEYGKK